MSNQVGGTVMIPAAEYEELKRDANRWRKFNKVAEKHYNREQGCITFYLPRALGGFQSFEEAVDSYK